MKSSSQTPREAPAVVVHGVRTEMVSVQVHSWLKMENAQNSKKLIVHRCSYTMVLTGQGGRDRILQHAALNPG